MARRHLRSRPEVRPRTRTRTRAGRPWGARFPAPLSRRLPPVLRVGAGRDSPSSIRHARYGREGDPTEEHRSLRAEIPAHPLRRVRRVREEGGSADDGQPQGARPKGRGELRTPVRTAQEQVRPGREPKARGEPHDPAEAFRTARRRRRLTGPGAGHGCGPRPTLRLGPTSSCTATRPVRAYARRALPAGCHGSCSPGGPSRRGGSRRPAPPGARNRSGGAAAPRARRTPRPPAAPC